MLALRGFRDDDAELRAAARDGDLQRIEALLAAGVDVNQASPSEPRDAPLHCACRSGQLEAVRLLVARGANPAQLGGRNGSTTALKIAVEAEAIDVARFLLAECGVQPSVPDDEGNTALMAAAGRGHTELVDLLLEYKADPNKGNAEGNTALFFACEHGHTAISRLLIRSGCNVDLANANGISPLTIAATNDHMDTVLVLLQSGCNPRVVDSHGNNILHIATRAGHDDVVRFVLNEFPKVNPNVANTSGLTPLVLACHNGHGAIAEMLAAKSQRRDTLHMACRNGHTDIAMDLAQSEEFLRTSSFLSEEETLSPKLASKGLLRLPSVEEEPQPMVQRSSSSRTPKLTSIEELSAKIGEQQKANSPRARFELKTIRPFGHHANLRAAAGGHEATPLSPRTTTGSRADATHSVRTVQRVGTSSDRVAPHHNRTRLSLLSMPHKPVRTESTRSDQSNISSTSSDGGAVRQHHFLRASSTPTHTAVRISPSLPTRSQDAAKLPSPKPSPTFLHRAMVSTPTTPPSTEHRSVVPVLPLSLSRQGSSSPPPPVSPSSRQTTRAGRSQPVHTSSPRHVFTARPPSRPLTKASPSTSPRHAQSSRNSAPCSPRMIKSDASAHRPQGHSPRQAATRIQSTMRAPADAVATPTNNAHLKRTATTAPHSPLTRHAPLPTSTREHTPKTTATKPRNITTIASPRTVIVASPRTVTVASPRTVTVASPRTVTVAPTRATTTLTRATATSPCSTVTSPRSTVTSPRTAVTSTRSTVASPRTRTGTHAAATSPRTTVLSPRTTVLSPRNILTSPRTTAAPTRRSSPPISPHTLSQLLESHRAPQTPQSPQTPQLPQTPQSPQNHQMAPPNLSPRANATQSQTVQHRSFVPRLPIPPPAEVAVTAHPDSQSSTHNTNRSPKLGVLRVTKSNAHTAPQNPHHHGRPSENHNTKLSTKHTGQLTSTNSRTTTSSTINQTHPTNLHATAQHATPPEPVATPVPTKHLAPRVPRVSLKISPAVKDKVASQHSESPAIAAHEQGGPHAHHTTTPGSSGTSSPRDPTTGFGMLRKRQGTTMVNPSGDISVRWQENSNSAELVASPPKDLLVILGGLRTGPPSPP